MNICMYVCMCVSSCRLVCYLYVLPPHISSFRNLPLFSNSGMEIIQFGYTGTT